MIEELVARIFATRNAAHIEHWRTKSYAQHVALGDFYGGLMDGIDAIIEAHQGAFGLVSIGALDKQPKVTNIVTMLEDDMEWIAKHRKGISGGIPAIDNLLQGLEDSYLSTLYKLNNLA